MIQLFYHQFITFTPEIIVIELSIQSVSLRYSVYRVSIKAFCSCYAIKWNELTSAECVSACEMLSLSYHQQHKFTHNLAHHIWWRIAGLKEETRTPPALPRGGIQHLISFHFILNVYIINQSEQNRWISRLICTHTHTHTPIHARSVENAPLHLLTAISWDDSVC